MATKLSSALVAPSKVASILDWRKSAGAVMGLDITRERIGVALSEHPHHRYGQGSMPLNSISLQATSNTKRSPLDETSVSELEAAVRRHRVCAFVVNWPEHEGRMGERCGKVLQVLDSVVDKSSRIVTRKRPFTLWCSRDDASAAAEAMSCPIDEWGRSSVFARTPAYTPGMTFCSKSILLEKEGSSSLNASLVAANVLDEWVKNHWDIDARAGRDMSPRKTKRGEFFFSARSVDKYNSETASLQAALL